MSHRSEPPKTVRPPETIATDGDVPPVVVGKHAPSILAWLAKPDKTVTRAEFWEMLHRYEAGRRRLTKHYRWYRRVARAIAFLGRRLLAWLRAPIIDRSPEKEPPA